MSKVNTTPVGLQNLLGNVNQGVNPAELSQVIVPMVDLYPHWAQRKLRALYETAPLVGVGGAEISAVVPEGELWQPIGLSFSRLTPLATTDMMLSVGISPPAAAGDYTRFATRWGNNVPIGVFTVATSFPDRFVLSGGWALTGQIDSISSATTRDCYLNAIYIKLTD